MYALFDRFAGRYDLHTPPTHYQHDHGLVLSLAASARAPRRLLDVGCGTGVLLEALQAGAIVRGIDASPGMVELARARVGRDAVACRRMQDLEDDASFDLVVSLSWTLNYCDGPQELGDVVRRMHRALRPGGRVLLQVAHAANVDGELMTDHERGPTGVEEDVTFSYRFVPLDPKGLAMRAEYSYRCRSLGEELREDHVLRVTDARAVASAAGAAGFDGVEIYDSWRRNPFSRSPSPFVSGRKPGVPA